MTINEFNVEFARLEAHFRINQDDRAIILKDWFRALSTFPIDALSAAVDEVIQHATDTFWPALGIVVERIRARVATRSSNARVKCATCNDSSWIEAWPWWSNGHVYSGFQRCPDCGVPEPSYANHQYRTPLTANEYALWKSGQLQQPEVPVQRGHQSVKRSSDTWERFQAPAFETLKIRSREPGEEG